MQLNETGVNNLVCAIVKKAVDDWRDAKRKSRRNPGNKLIQGEIIDCENFFKSDYFEGLTGMDGKEFLNRLKKQSLEECRRERREKA